MTRKSLGICVGASTVSFVETSGENGIIRIESVRSVAHEGNPKRIISHFFDGYDCSDISVVATGRKFKQLLSVHTIPEPQAIELSMRFLKLSERFDVAASLGGENFIVYCFNENGNAEKILTGNKCASGTGEFFLQQIGRMNIGLDEAVSLPALEGHYAVSGRCSVFCKSDCTHALNKGVNKGHVIAGLCRMIAEKTTELLSKQNSRNVLLIGGVTRIPSIVSYIRQKYPEAEVPAEAHYFEALGASLLGQEKFYSFNTGNLFKSGDCTFPTLPPLKESDKKVIFKTINRSEALNGDECILGLDVGSTTTKAVLLRCSDNALVASSYLRTNGSPVTASIECYKSLKKQFNAGIKIIGLGTTGSGRHIAALHALSKGVVNEIIAHAVAAAHFDKDVDTIFEIGGQDAKYTHLTNGIASDYAMNEACSAGTGSFLEEAAKESLNINYTGIGDIAFTAKTPLNFNDQCSAFISSDIKNASHDGATKEDIVAGLVYSVCMNYVNRVKGNRTSGKKIFMQGGVCYNKAVPYAMSNLTGKEIIVPPEPGLMGAFGVALEIKNRIRLHLLNRQEFNLDELIHRSFEYGKEFTCAGGNEKCDRKCSISVVKIQDKKYPFGGACSKYYNQINNIKSKPATHNLVRLRQELVYNKYCLNPQADGKTIGIVKSFQTNTLYPLYYNFFNKLGFRVVLSDGVDKGGTDKMTSSFCFPVEISHGLFENLVRKKTDYIFLPHITEMDNEDGHKYKRLCVFVQGESYLLRSTFRDDNLPEIISPVINFSEPEREIRKVFTGIAKQLGKSRTEADRAFTYAFGMLKEMLKEFKETGRKKLEEINSEPGRIAVVLFGRAYNAFASEANLNIPHKFASKNITIIPHDFIPSADYESYDNMYWFSGQQILRSARFVKENENLFGVFITNFSCGPDSFILSYFRNIMGTKPSLTLELDSHSADVGVETRIDAALDIIKNYIELKKKSLVKEKTEMNNTLSVINGKNGVKIVDVSGKEFVLSSPEVEVIIPSMGKYSTMAFAAICRSMGINSKPLPVPTIETLKHGRGLTTCKECLPFILTSGQLIEFIKKEKLTDKKILFFMPHGYGPCRQGQYHVLLKDIINDMGVINIGVLSMDDESSFSDLGDKFFLNGWIALLIADAVHDIENVISVLAENKNSALELLETGWNRFIDCLESGNEKTIFSGLQEFSEALTAIKLKNSLEETKTVSLVGEIYVRREEFSRGDLVKTLMANGFVVKTAPITEYIYYSNYLLKKGIVNDTGIKEKAKIFIKDFYQKHYEKKIKKILSKSGLYRYEEVDIDKTISCGKNLVSEKLVGETILTAGLSLREILDDACGVISIGPFNCMPSRLSEALLNKEMTLEGKHRSKGIKRNGYPEELSALPFLYVESDGNPFPQITQSRIEVFMLQATKVHNALNRKRNKKLKGHKNLFSLQTS